MLFTFSYFTVLCLPIFQVLSVQANKPYFYSLHSLTTLSLSELYMVVVLSQMDFKQEECNFSSYQVFYDESTMMVTIFLSNCVFMCARCLHGHNGVFCGAGSGRLHREDKVPKTSNE